MEPELFGASSAMKSIAQAADPTGIAGQIESTLPARDKLIEAKEYEAVINLNNVLDEHALTAINTLSEIMVQDEEPITRISAAKALLTSAGQYVAKRREFVTGSAKSGQTVNVFVKNNVLSNPE